LTQANTPSEWKQAEKRICTEYGVSLDALRSKVWKVLTNYVDPVVLKERPETPSEDQTTIRLGLVVHAGHQLGNYGERRLVEGLLTESKHFEKRREVLCLILGRTELEFDTLVNKYGPARGRVGFGV
jgi:hypothetical protein